VSTGITELGVVSGRVVSSVVVSAVVTFVVAAVVVLGLVTGGSVSAGAELYSMLQEIAGIAKIKIAIMKDKIFIVVCFIGGS
jgi:hypothetical protein